MAGISMGEDAGDSVDRTVPYVTPDPFLHVGLPGTQWLSAAAVVAYLPDPAAAAYAQTAGSSFTEYETLEEALAAVRDGQVLSLFGERDALTPLVEASSGDLAILAGWEEMKIKPGVAMALRADDIDPRFALTTGLPAYSLNGGRANGNCRFNVMKRVSQ
jgi:polar amino acid transport system substrate-binding protein